MTIRTADKVLYLDFDGPCHHEEVYWHPKRGIYIKEPGRTLFEWLPILERLLEPYSDVAIVLSTSWVREKSFHYAKSRLTPSLQARVIGATFHRRVMVRQEFAQLTRGQQVAADVVRRGPKAWFAIDDDDEGWPEWCRKNLIKVDGETGISEPQIQEAIQVTLERL